MKTAPKHPTAAKLKRGYSAFQKHLPRDSTYKTASYLVEHFWQAPEKLADSLGVLLLTWNQAFYRYGTFDFEALERCIKKNHGRLSQLRQRHILDSTESDHAQVRRLFADFYEALANANPESKKFEIQSPVATAKALHLLAPSFFPLWDQKIANGHRCSYSKDPIEAYLRFFERMKAIALSLPETLRDGSDNRTLLKLIDEYNFACYTRSWVKP